MKAERFGARKVRRYAVFAACASVIGLSLAGCSVVDAELHKSGGVVGAASEGVFSAPTKELQVYRAAIAMALIGGIAQVSVKEPQDATIWVTRVVDTATDIRNMYALATYNSSDPDCAQLKKECGDYPARFESLVPHLESRLYHLAVASVTDRDLGAVQADIASQNYIALPLHFARAGGRVLAAAHQMAATYRSVTEGVALATLRSRVERAKEADKTLDNVEDAYTYLKKVIDEVGERAARKELTLKPQDFDFLFKLALRSCSDVAGRSDVGSEVTTSDGRSARTNDMRELCDKELVWNKAATTTKSP